MAADHLWPVSADDLFIGPAAALEGSPAAALRHEPLDVITQPLVFVDVVRLVDDHHRIRRGALLLRLALHLDAALLFLVLLVRLLEPVLALVLVFFSGCRLGVFA